MAIHEVVVSSTWLPPFTSSPSSCSSTSATSSSRSSTRRSWKTCATPLPTFMKALTTSSTSPQEDYQSSRNHVQRLPSFLPSESSLEHHYTLPTDVANSSQFSAGWVLLEFLSSGSDQTGAVVAEVRSTTKTSFAVCGRCDFSPNEKLGNIDGGSFLPPHKHSTVCPVCACWLTSPEAHQMAAVKEVQPLLRGGRLRHLRTANFPHSVFRRLVALVRSDRFKDHARRQHGLRLRTHECFVGRGPHRVHVSSQSWETLEEHNPCKRFSHTRNASRDCCSSTNSSRPAEQTTRGAEDRSTSPSFRCFFL